MKEFESCDYGGQCQKHLMVEEIERLRALVKQAEFSNRAQAIRQGFCPWCDGNEGDHLETCPAFTPTGEVK